MCIRPALCRASTSCFGRTKAWMAGTSPAMVSKLYGADFLIEIEAIAVA